MKEKSFKYFKHKNIMWECGRKIAIGLKTKDDGDGTISTNDKLPSQDVRWIIWNYK